MFKQKIKKAIQFLINPKLMLCLGIGWLITNGWSYIMFGIGSYYQIGWMIAISGAYLAFLWVPFTFEKIVTIAIAILLMRWWFPNDIKTLGVLKRWHQKTKDLIQRKKQKAKTDTTNNHDSTTS